MKFSGILTETKEENHIQHAIDKILTNRTFDKLRANIDGFEAPAQLAKVSGAGAYVPDITGTKNGRKYYYEVAIKNNKIKETISKWKLLSKLAKLKRGKFYLVVPKGNFAFVKRLLAKYSIKAQVIKMQA